MLFDEDLDETGERVPRVWRAASLRLNAMAPGTVLRLYSDDPAARAEVPHRCTEGGHECVGTIARKDGWHFFIRKG